DAGGPHGAPRPRGVRARLRHPRPPGRRHLADSRLAFLGLSRRGQPCWASTALAHDVCIPGPVGAPRRGISLINTGLRVRLDSLAIALVVGEIPRWARDTWL